MNYVKPNRYRYPKICRVCRKDFKGSHKKQLFCSPDCFYKFKRDKKDVLNIEYTKRSTEASAKSSNRKCRRGYKHTKESREKMSIAIKRSFEDPREKEKKIKVAIKNLPKNVSGENNGNFRNWATKKSKSFRIQNSSKFTKWRKEVLKKCNHKCVLCGETKGRLDAHHIIPLCETTKPAFELWNGVILCRKCHVKTDSFGGKARILNTGDRKIITKIVPLQFQEYQTLGNYKDIDDETYFIITDTGNDTYNKSILVHEIVEQLLTEYEGIKEPDILAFDLWVEEEIKKGNYPEDAEPGDHPLCPYKKQHDFAMNIERQIMNFLNIDFTQYDKQVMTTFKK